MKVTLEIDYDEEAIGTQELIRNLQGLLAVNKVKIVGENK